MLPIIKSPANCISVSFLSPPFPSWTAADLSVTCRQLGFGGGKYWEWQDRANNDTSTLLYQAPNCTGLEDQITKCAWHTHAMGGGVCGE